MSAIIVIAVLVGGLSSYVLFFMNSPVSVELINSNNGGNIAKNSQIVNNIPKSKLIDNITEMAKIGTPVVKFGNGGPCHSHYFRSSWRSAFATNSCS